MLGTPNVEQVAGDGLTGLFRARQPQDLPLRRTRAGHAVEAYSWGALTSNAKGVLGWLQRVLWMGLLPFALVNLAYWARHHVGEDNARSRWGAVAVRWAAALLTMLFMLTISLVAVDLVAWQCYRGGTRGCDVLPGALDFMMRLSPSRRIAVSAAVPLAAVVVLWFLSFRSLARYESVELPDGRRRGRHREQLLRRPTFWQAVERTRRLQRLHLVAAAATVVAFIGVHADSRTDRWYAGWPWWAAVVLLAGVAWRLAVPHSRDIEVAAVPGPSAGPVDGRRWADRALAWGAVLLVAAHLGWLWLDPTDSGGWNLDTGWRGHNAWFIAVFVAVTLLNTIVFLAGRMRTTATVLMVVSFACFAAWMAVSSTSEAKATDPDGLGLGALDEPLVGGLPVTRLAAAAAFVAVWFCLLLGWHLLNTRRYRATAWRGGAPAMLLGAAAWIALLFTTAAVTAAAEYLNGDTQTVADLSSTYQATGQTAAPPDEPVEVHLVGDVVLSDAVLVIEKAGGDDDEDPAPVLHRGRVTATAARVPFAGSEPADYPQQRKLPDIALSRGLLTMDQASVELVDSCLLTVPPERDEPTCDAESPGFVSRTVIDLPGPQPTGSLALEAQGQRVRLDVAEAPRAPLVVPQVLIWAPVAQLAWMLAVGGVALGALYRLARRVLPDLARQVRLDPAVPADCKKAAVARRFTAAFAHRSERGLELVGGLTVLTVLLLLVLAATGSPPWTVMDAIARRRAADAESAWWTWADLAHPLATASLYAVLALSLGLVAVGSYLRRSESARKAVGVIWDLTTFWPRAAHPLAPPCYAERVVPELTTRIRWALRSHPKAIVVVSGHSQGSLIAVATLLGLEDCELRRVRLVTYGSQVRALYGRIFPAVVGSRVVGYRKTDGTPRFGDGFPDVTRWGTPRTRPAAKGSLRARLGEGRWVNLFRRTDPLGWRVFSDADSALDVAVPEVPPPKAGDPGPTVMAHSGYQHTAAYRRLVGGWLGEDVLPDHAATVAELRPVPPE